MARESTNTVSSFSSNSSNRSRSNSNSSSNSNSNSSSSSRNDHGSGGTRCNEGNPDDDDDYERAPLVQPVGDQQAQQQKQKKHKQKQQRGMTLNTTTNRNNNNHRNKPKHNCHCHRHSSTWKKRASVLILSIVGLLCVWVYYDGSPSRKASTDLLPSSSILKTNRTAGSSVSDSDSPTSSSISSLKPSPSSVTATGTTAAAAALSSSPSPAQLFQCSSSDSNSRDTPVPPPLPSLAAADTRHHLDWYQKESARLIASSNVSEYLRVFRECEFDNWGHTYNQVKEGMYDWKAKHFAELLQNDDGDDDHNNNSNNNVTTRTIYESACGIGLNLYMTLEILLEQFSSSLSKKQGPKKLTHIVVYGNEYQADSTQLAREITSHESFPGMPGTICQGDSTNLSFVPSNTFDLVYTGYISPLSDPLNLADQFHIETDQDLFSRYTEYCESYNNHRDNNDTARLVDRAQQIQEHWYAQWVGEMIRIAKPGAKILVEQVSYPLCRALFDWGGVSQNFWKRAISKYNWDVDPKSIEYQDDTIFRQRYHLVMRKNKKKKQQ